VTEEGQRVSPISRERAYARRRYDKWQAKLADKQQRRAAQRRKTLIASVAVLAVLAVAGVLLWMHQPSDSGGSLASGATTSPSASAVASSSPSASASATASASAGPNPCPAPTVKPPATPQSFATAPDAALAQGRSWKLTLTTSCGTIVAELDGAKAPKAVANAIFLSGKKFWDGSPCHRLGLGTLKMLQCGDPTGTGTGGPGYQFGPVENAPADGVYKRGVLAMARASSQSSQGSQFFILFGDTPLPGGYTVFGQIVQGLDVIDKVAAGGVASVGQDGGSGAPSRAISIVSTNVTPA
jgi:peptidyl-prolyl cis-trans isomerase B (cyclophilin B)